MLAYLPEDILVTIVLNSPIELLYDIFTKKKPIPYLRCLLKSKNVVTLLCVQHSVVPQATFIAFLNSHDFNGGLLNLSLDYISNRWSQTHTALSLIKKCTYRTDVIDFLLEDQDLYQSRPHTVAATLVTCHDRVISDDYLYTHGAHKCRGIFERLLIEIVFKGYSLEHWDSLLTTQVLRDDAAIDYLLGKGKWDLIQIDALGGRSVFACAILCGNVELASDPTEVPDSIRPYVDTSIPSMDDLFEYLIQSVTYALPPASVDFLKIDNTFLDIPAFCSYLQVVGTSLTRLDFFRYLDSKGVNVTSIRCLCSQVLLHERDPNTDLEHYHGVMFFKEDEYETVHWLECNGCIVDKNMVYLDLADLEAKRWYELNINN